MNNNFLIIYFLNGIAQKEHCIYREQTSPIWTVRWSISVLTKEAGRETLSSGNV